VIHLQMTGTVECASMHATQALNCMQGCDIVIQVSAPPKSAVKDLCRSYASQ